MTTTKIDSSSANTASSALAVFETPPTNVGIASSCMRQILTLNPISDPPYTIKLHPGSNLVDLSNVYLETEMQIVKKLGAGHVPITAEDKVGVIQGVGAVWPRNIRILINGREQYNSNQLYAYKAYMDMELSYNRSVKSSYLKSCGYYPSAESSTNVDDKEDTGYKARKALFAEGKKVQFYTKLNADIFSSDLYLVNNVSIEIVIDPHDSKFLLLNYDDNPAGTEYKLVITELKLFCKYVEVMPGVAIDIEQRLQKTPARYAVRRSELKSMVITGGRTQFQTNVFNDQLPRRVIVALVDTAAYNGAMDKNPFRFKSNHVRDISLVSGGVTWPSVLYNMDWNAGTYMRCYHDFMAGIGLANSLESNGISPQQFKDGWCFFTFVMTSDLENTPAFELIKAGTTSLMIHFSEKVPTEGLVAIVYGEFDGLLFIDHNRQLTSDVTA